MIAEYIIAAIIVAFLLGLVIGEEHGRRVERIHARYRVRRAFRIGGLRHW